MNADSDIFVFPTQYETWGLVVNEAMQASLPVIASKEGSLPEIVDDGVTGFLLKENTPEHLAEKIEQLIKDPDLRIKMGKAGYEKYRKYYTSEIRQNMSSLSGLFSPIVQRSCGNAFLLSQLRDCHIVWWCHLSEHSFPTFR